MPLPFSTSTDTRRRGRSGCDGTGGAVWARTAGLACGPAAARTACCLGASWIAPIAISAKSSTAASAPTTSVAVRHGNVAGSPKAWSTARLDSRRVPSFLLSPRHPAPRSRETLVQRHLGTPVELTCCEPRVEDAPLQLAEPRRRELRLARDATRPLDRGVQLEHGGLPAGADVEHAALV